MATRSTKNVIIITLNSTKFVTLQVLRVKIPVDSLKMFSLALITISVSVVSILIAYASFVARSKST